MNNYKLHSINKITLIIILFFVSCEKEKPDFSYDIIVDSSFFCEATVGGEHLTFPFHDRPTFGTEIYGDSILIKAFLNYRESDAPYVNLFWITISKKFKISELTYAINNNGIPYSAGDISNEEFESIFKNGSNNYSYLDCFSNECNKSDGVEISLDSYLGTTYKTEYTGKFVAKKDLNTFNETADFEISKMEWLSKDVVIIEGEFSTDIYSFNGDLIPIRDGYFKAYCNNIMYPEVVNNDLLWNK